VLRLDAYHVDDTPFGVPSEIVELYQFHALGLDWPRELRVWTPREHIGSDTKANFPVHHASWQACQRLGAEAELIVEDWLDSIFTGHLGAVVQGEALR
jgi:hypothetical protein